MQEAGESQIPVVVFDSGLADGATYLSYIATDNYHGGQLAAQQLAVARRDHADESGHDLPGSAYDRRPYAEDGRSHTGYNRDEPANNASSEPDTHAKRAG